MAFIVFVIVYTSLLLFLLEPPPSNP